MSPFRPPPLYPIVDVAGRESIEPAISLADEVLAAGATWLQLRAKSLTAGEHLALAVRLVERAARRGARVIVNDRLDVALASGAAGVHLGQDDLPLAAARPLAFARGLVVGVSTHDVAQARAAAAGGADYVGFGPMFATTTKPDALPPRLAGALAAVRAAVAVPIVAIGGITEEAAPGVLAAGADAVAIIGALATAPDPRAMATRLLALRPAQIS